MIWKDVAIECLRAGNHETNDRLPREPCGGLGTKRLGFMETDRQEFCKGDGGVSSQEFVSLLKIGHEVVFSSGKSDIRHLNTGAC